MMKYRAAIFDLDGTLINSLEDLADSVNEMLEHYGFPTHPLEPYRYYVGNGARKLLERTLPRERATNKNFVDEALRYYDGCYQRHLTIKTKPYDGIIAMLDRLKALRIPLGIVTNKQDFAAQEITAKLFPSGMFDEVIGDRDGLPRKPDPAKALKIAAAFGVEPSGVAYFGDTSVDMQTAINAGFLPIGVTWGFRPESELLESGARLIIHHPLELFEHVEFQARNA